MQQNYNNSIRDFVFGANDGLAISLVLLAGLSTALNLPSQFHNASIIILLWGSLITSLSVLSAGHSELKDYTRKLGFLKDDQSLKIEIETTQNFIMELGLGRSFQIIATKELEEERANLIKYPRIPLPLTTSPLKMAFRYFVGFAIAALIPLVSFSFYFFHEYKTLIALIIAAPCLFILNFLKGYFTGINKLFSAVSFTFLTIAAAILIYILSGILS